MKFSRFAAARFLGLALAFVFFVAPAPSHAVSATDSTFVLPFSLSIAPAHPTVCDSVWLVVNVPCTECTAVEVPSKLDSTGTAITWRSLPCTGAICTPRSLRVLLGRFAAGSFHLNVVTVRVDDGVRGLPVIVPLEFQVSGNCTPAPTHPSLERLHIGLGSPCDSCESTACPGAPIPVTLSGLLPSSCWSLSDVRVTPRPAAFGEYTVTARFDHACALRGNGGVFPCSEGPVEWARSIFLPAGLGGTHVVHVTLEANECPDTAHVAYRTLDRSYRVLETCPGLDSLPFATQAVVGSPGPCPSCPPVVCPGVVVPVAVSGWLPGDCWVLDGIGLEVPLGGVVADPVINVLVHRTALACTAPAPFAKTVDLNATQPGLHAFTLRVSEVVGGDAIQTFEKHYAFRTLAACDTLSRPTLDVVRIGEAVACDTCPPVACPNESVPVRLSGLLPDACWTVRSVRYVAPTVKHESAAVLVEFGRRCGAPCAVGPLPWSAPVLLPARLPGSYALDVRLYANVCPDTVAGLYDVRSTAYSVLDSCRTNPPLPFVQNVEIGTPSPCLACPPRICPGKPVRVAVSGELPSPCYVFEGVALDSSETFAPAPPTVNVRVRVVSAACDVVPVPFEGTAFLPPGAPGPGVMVLRVIETALNGTVRSWTQDLTFHTLESCDSSSAACVSPVLMPGNLISGDPTRCSVTVPPGRDGAITFFARVSAGGLAGLQGRIAMDSRLRLSRLDAVGAAAGMHLLWNARPAESAVDYVLYADHGAPVGPGGWIPVLMATFRPDSGFTSGEAPVMGTVSAASDSDGVAVPPCGVVDPGPSALFCIDATDTLACDVNHDGVVNVVDLVRMVRCWFHPERCGGIAAGPDCTGDGAFHLDDVMCCARQALGVRDSLRHDAKRLALSMDAPVDRGDGTLDATLVLRGASEMNGALLQLRYPADRYDWVADGNAGAAQAGWVPLYEAGTGDVVVGLLRVDDACADEVRVPVRLKLKAGRTHGGTLDVGSNAITGADGAALAVDVSHASTTLVPGETALPARVEFSAPRPNPTGGLTRFDFALPAAGEVDLALYDLAGRRVATLWKGAMTAGRHSLSWDASGTARGMYFARLRVGGEVRASRVTLQTVR